MHVGAPQGSILAATLFRLHIHFLPSIFFQTTTHLFADDLAILMTGSLEKRFSLNIVELEERAKHVMCTLEKYAENNLLPVNIKKTKAVLMHSVIAPPLPKLEYKKQKIEIVPSFKYLGVTITQKLGWGLYIDDKLKTIRKTYNAMKTLFYNIPKSEMCLRRRIFLAFSLPHFIWLMTTWFFFSENQQQKINKTFISGLKIVYGLYGWDDITTLILCQEKTLQDYIYAFWLRFSIHLEKSLEATSYQHTWTAFQAITTLDKTLYKKFGGESQGTVVAGGNGSGNRLDQLSNPRYIFVDRDHSVYVSEYRNDRVMKWIEGAQQGIIVAGGPGKGNGLTQLSCPYGVVAEQLGTVYVADLENHRIVRWSKGATQGRVIVSEKGEGGQLAA
ncbi:unnamed protein product [Rotaria socialis]|nr:unnamed protein product [Rotaria socialis]